MRHTTGAMTAAGSTASRRPSPHPPSSALVTTFFPPLPPLHSGGGLAIPIRLSQSSTAAGGFEKYPSPVSRPCSPSYEYICSVCGGVRRRTQAYEQVQTSFSGPSSSSRLRLGRSYLCMHYVHKYHVSADYTSINQRGHRDLC